MSNLTSARAPQPVRLKVTLLSLPPRTQAVLEYFFAGAGRSAFAPSAETVADAAIFDHDNPDSRRHWEAFHQASGRPGILLSVQAQDVPDTVWVQKPATPAALVGAAARLTGGELLRRAAPAAEPEPRPAFAPPATPLPTAAASAAPAPAAAPAPVAAAAPVASPRPVAPPTTAAPAAAHAAASAASAASVPGPAPATAAPAPSRPVAAVPLDVVSLASLLPREAAVPAPAPIEVPVLAARPPVSPVTAAAIAAQLPEADPPAKIDIEPVTAPAARPEPAASAAAEATADAGTGAATGVAERTAPPVAAPLAAEAPAPAPAPAPAAAPHPRVSLLDPLDELQIFGAAEASTANGRTDPQQAFFSATATLQEAVGEAFRVARKWNGLTLLDTPAGTLIFDAPDNRAYLGFDPAHLTAMCQTLLAEPLRVQMLTPRDLARMKEEPGRLVVSEHADALVWRIAVLTSRGRLPLGTNTDVMLYLRRWPNITRLPHTPEALRLSALLAVRGASLLEAVRVLGIPQRYVFACYTGLAALDLVTQDGSHLKRRQRKGPKNRTLISRLFRWLSGKG